MLFLPLSCPRLQHSANNKWNGNSEHLLSPFLFYKELCVDVVPDWLRLSSHHRSATLTRSSVSILCISAYYNNCRQVHQQQEQEGRSSSREEHIYEFASRRKEKVQQEDGSCVSSNKQLSYAYITDPKSTIRFCLFIYLSVCLCLPPPPSPPRPHKVASRSPGHRNSSESH